MRGDCKRDTTLACGEETRHMLRNAPPLGFSYPTFGGGVGRDEAPMAVTLGEVRWGLMEDVPSRGQTGCPGAAFQPGSCWS